MWKTWKTLGVVLTACMSAFASTIILHPYPQLSTKSILQQHHQQLYEGYEDSDDQPNSLPSTLVANIQIHNTLLPVVMDTGSSDIVVRFQHPSSSSLASMIMIHYQTSTCIVRNETFSVTIGALHLPKQTVGSIVSGSLSSNIIGLGFPALSRLNPSGTVLPYFSSFSYFISQVHKKPSTIEFNTINEDNYMGDLVYAQVVGTTYWQTPLHDIYIDHTPLQVCQGTCMVIFDTGTSVIRGPYQAIDMLLSFLIAYNHNKTTFDCHDIESLPDLRVEIGVKDKDASYTGTIQVTLEPYFYMQRFQGVCLPAFATTTTENTWIFGETFLRKYYTVFDVKQKRIGLAVSSHSVLMQTFYSQSPKETRSIRVEAIHDEVHAIKKETEETQSFASVSATTSGGAASSAGGASNTVTSVTLGGASPTTPQSTEKPTKAPTKGKYASQ